MRTKNRTDKRGRIRRSAEQRRERIEAYKASGLSQAGFCRREGIHPTTLNHWLRSRAKRGKARPALPRRAKACGFARVEVALVGGAVPTRLAGEAGWVEIELRSGLRIRVQEARRLGELVEFIRQMQGTPEASPC